MVNSSQDKRIVNLGHIPGGSFMQTLGKMSGGIALAILGMVISD